VSFEEVWFIQQGRELGNSVAPHSEDPSPEAVLERGAGLEHCPAYMVGL